MRRRPREVWEQQYTDGSWDYLADPDEAGHYLAIAELCNIYMRLDGELLDVGCGTGLLPGYLRQHAGLAPSSYTGIDFARAALARARASWPTASFACLDVSRDAAPGTYDAIVFNETLYCFDDPLAVLDKCIAENARDDTMLFISMYGDHHGPLWDALSARCATVDERLVENARGVKWRVRASRAGRLRN